MKKENYNEIVQGWMKEIEENYMYDAEHTLKYCNDVIEYGFKMQDDALIAYGHFYCATIYYVLNDGTHFFEAVSSALAYLTKADEGAMMARCYNFMGIMATGRGNAVIAADYYQNAIEYAEKVKDHLFVAMVSINVGALNIICGRYKEAIEILVPVYEDFPKYSALARYADYMRILLANMAKAYLFLGETDKARECFEKIHTDYEEEDSNYAMITVLCTEAIYYDKVGDWYQCEDNIARIHKETTPNVPIMDMFEDYYDYSELLLRLGRHEEFWHLIEVMEPTVKTLDCLNMQLKLISLKIKFYRQNGQSADYLQAAGLYYELSERAQQETRQMMNAALNLRRTLKQIERENRILQIQSETDPLTGLHNRLALNAYSEALFTKCKEEKLPLTVEILDIDDFKGFNDHYGHQSGDECLVALANVLKVMEEKYGAYVARYGGDEFIVIYVDIDRDCAISYAQELRRMVLEKAVPFPHSKIADVVTISQGLCHDVPAGGNRMWDYLHVADNMLYRTKEKARNNYTIGNVKETEVESS